MRHYQQQKLLLVAVNTARLVARYGRRSKGAAEAASLSNTTAPVLLAKTSPLAAGIDGQPVLFRLSQVIQRGVVGLLRVYQRTLSPDHGWLRIFFPAGVCRFEPTCSVYMVRAIQQDGWYGMILGARRILRCHPFAAGGVDMPPVRRQHK